MVRSCKYCYGMMITATPATTPRHSQNHLPTHEVDSLDTSDEVINITSTSEQLSTSRSFSNWPDSPTDDFTSPAEIRNSPFHVFDVSDNKRNHFQQTLSKDQLMKIWIKMNDKADGVDFKDHRFRLRRVTRTSTGIELVEWLENFFSDRQQAKDVCQELLQQKFISSLNGDQNFQDDYCLYQALTPPLQSPPILDVEDQDFVIPMIRKSASSSRLLNSSHTLAVSSAPRSTSLLIEKTYNEHEPIWVKEIEYENKSVTTVVQEPRESVKDLSDYIFSDVESEVSFKSVQSLTSTVEIDNEFKTIKYSRSTKQKDEDNSPRSDYDGLMPRKFCDFSLTEINAEYIRRLLAWNGTRLSHDSGFTDSLGWYLKPSSQMTTHEKQLFGALKKLYFQHSLIFLKQLLRVEGLNLGWAKILASLVKHICEIIDVDVDVNMDICHYVHVKKLLDGYPNQSNLLNGVVCTKNIIHNQMKKKVENPIILLLGTPLEYERVQYKLSSLDQIIRQEPEFFKNLVSRIVARNPDVIISGCTISRFARNLLLKAGITLVINVKESVMERLSRSTGADIVLSIDQLQTAKLGTCGSFQIVSYLDGKREYNRTDGILQHTKNAGNYTDKKKVLMMVDGCESSRGCTVLLRDTSSYPRDISTEQVMELDKLTKIRLSRVKKIFLFCVRLSFHHRLELSYLLDQQAASTLNLIPVKNRINSSDICHKRTNSGQPLEDLIVTNNNLSIDSIPSASTSNLSLDEYSTTEPPIKQLFLKAFGRRFFSTSILSVPKAPFLTTNKGQTSSMNHFLKKPVYWSSEFVSNESCDVESSDDLLNQDSIDVQINRSKESSSENLTNIDSTDVSIKQNSVKKMASNQPSDALNTSMSQPSKDSPQDAFNFEPKDRNYVRLPESISWSSTTLADVECLSQASIKSYKLNCEDDNWHVWENDIFRQIFHELKFIEEVDEDEKDVEKVEKRKTEEIVDIRKLGWSENNGDILSVSLTKSAFSSSVRDLLADFRAEGISLKEEDEDIKKEVQIKLNDKDLLNEETNISEKVVIDCLNTYNHQHLSVLFRSYSHQSPNEPYCCVSPWVVDIDFYSFNDITFGGFLERYCFRSNYYCNNSSCKRPMVEHVRSFVRGGVGLNIILKELSKAILPPQILSWSWNTESEKSTDIKVLSEDAAKMSFAKFLEVRLETFEADDKKEEVLMENRLIENPFTSYQYFLQKDMVAAFKCYKVTVNEVILPPVKINIQQRTSWLKFNDKESRYKRIVEEANNISKIQFQILRKIEIILKDTEKNAPTFPDDVITSRSLSSNPTSNENGIDSLRQSRECCLAELSKLRSNDFTKLRQHMDQVNLYLQEARVSQQHDVEEADPTSLELSESKEIELSKLLLCLRFLINKLVSEWNQRLRHISHQDRQIIKGSKLPGNRYTLSLPQQNPEDTDESSDVSFFHLESSHSNIASFASNLSGSSQSISLDHRSYSLALGSSEKSEKSRSNKRVSLDFENGISIEKPNSRFLKRASSTIVSVFRSSSTTSLLQAPFPEDQFHHLPQCVLTNILIREDEPTSIIAYSLRSRNYQDYLDLYFGNHDNNSSSSPSEIFCASQGCLDANRGSFGESLYDEDIDEDVFKDDAKLNPKDPTQDESPRPSSSHLEVQFGDSVAQFYCKIYFVIGFKDLRELILGEDEDRYIDSISQCIKWEAKGGKSGSSFYKSQDDRFIFKEMSRLDLLSFVGLAPSYFGYITHALKNKQPTAISKILGVYRISYRNSTTNRSFKTDLLVMENLFYKRKIKQIYDLKGSVRNRRVKTTSSYSAGAGDEDLDELYPDESLKTVLQDENFLVNTLDHPIYVHEHTKKTISCAFSRDTQFLSHYQIIDYSLLVGIDEENKDIIIGIIDYMCPYNWGKKLEHVVKSYNLIVKQGTRALPTVVSPEVYQKRFCDAMSRYFHVMPDRWYGMLQDS